MSWISNCAQAKSRWLAFEENSPNLTDPCTDEFSGKNLLSETNQPSSVRSIIACRCPRCGSGRVYHSFWKMHPRCPNCQLDYHREPGYYVGAMYASYGLAILLGLPSALVMFLYGIHSTWIGLAVILQLIVLSPLLFRYSRVMWLHFDQRMDPQ